MSLLLLTKYPSVEDEALGGLIHPETHQGRFFRRCMQAAIRRSAFIGRPKLLSCLPTAHSKIENLFAKATEGKRLGIMLSRQKVGTFGFLKEEFEKLLIATLDNIQAQKPTCVLAMGVLPLFICTGEASIASLRGTVLWSNALKCKVVPTYDIEAVNADWSLRSAFTFDIAKAMGESLFPEVRLKRRVLSVVERPGELSILARGFDRDGLRPLAIDVETEAGQITSIAFGFSELKAAVVPFWDKTKPDWCAFAEPDEWAIRREILHLLTGKAPKLFHNATYDLSYIRAEGFTVNGEWHDSMLCAHALQPELPKSLGHLGSLHANEGAWKLLNKMRKKDINKDNG